MEMSFDLLRKLTLCCPLRLVVVIWLEEDRTTSDNTYRLKWSLDNIPTCITTSELHEFHYRPYTPFINLSSSDHKPFPLRRVLVIFLISTLWALYSKVLHAPFVYDDKIEVIGNQTIRFWSEWKDILLYNPARALLQITYAYNLVLQNLTLLIITSPIC